MKRALISLGCALLAGSSLLLNAQNPYMPLWEHIPDGEPYVFDDPDQPGKKRVYVYGSHDSLVKYYCGREQVVWSAPVDDLSSWRYDGRVYGYWGFGNSYAAELDPVTMCTVKPGTEIVVDMVSGRRQEGDFRFFEASSMRKIKDKYVFIFSRVSPAEEYGIGKSNYTLAYGYSDNPLGPFTYGGTLIDGRGRDTDANGRPIYTANPNGNTHGSICEINGKWWVFYHRQTGTDEYSRQAMVAPIEVSVEEGKGGKVSISEAEFNSEGFATDGLNPLHKTPAGIACYLTGPEPYTDKFPNYFFSGSYIQVDRLDPESFVGPFNQKICLNPIVNNTSGSTVGYKYFNFDSLAGKSGVTFHAGIIPEGVDGTVTLLLGSPYQSKGGKEIGRFSVSASMPRQATEASCAVVIPSDMAGKQPLFLLFNSPEKGKSILTLSYFRFTL